MEAGNGLHLAFFTRLNLCYASGVMGCGMKAFSQDLVDEVVRLRAEGMTREAVAQRLGLTVSQIKNIQTRARFSLPPDKRQENARAGRLAKDPDAWETMRKSLTPEVLERRAASVRTAWRDETLRAEVSKASKRRWRDIPEEDRTKYRGRDVHVVAQRLGMRCDLDADAPIPLGRDGLQLHCHCGRLFHVRSFDFLYMKVRSCGCVKSHAQGEIADLLRQAGLEVFENVRHVISPLEIDIWVPSLSLAIEYCGLHYHSEIHTPEKARRRHLEKLQACERLGIRLVTVFSDEWIQRRAICCAYLQALSGLPGQRVGARKCEVAEVDIKTAAEFFDAHHLQAAGAETRCWGLRHSGELVAVAGFRHRGDGVWELSRYALTERLHVAGGLQRLLSGAVAVLRPTRIVTFSDRRWSSGGIYERSGFIAAEVLPPGYWYIKKGSDRHRWHRSKFRKAALGVGDEVTEHEEMAARGYARIWDCGLVRWEMDLTPSSSSAIVAS